MAEYIVNIDGWLRTLTGESIVRCRDCKHYDEIIHACEHPCVTKLRGDCPENWIFSCFDNDFCAWGEQKKGGQDE